MGNDFSIRQIHHSSVHYTIIVAIDINVVVRDHVTIRQAVMMNKLLTSQNFIKFFKEVKRLSPLCQCSLLIHLDYMKRWQYLTSTLYELLFALLGKVGQALYAADNNVTFCFLLLWVPL